MNGKMSSIFLMVLISIFTITFTAPSFAQTAQEIAIKPGFNFISFTVIPAVTPNVLKQQYSDINEIYYFSAAGGSFISAGEGTLTTLGTGKGYIFKSSSQFSMTVSGNVLTTIGDINLKAGFNLSGFSKMPEAIAANALMIKYSIVKGIYKWSPSAGAFLQVVRNNSGAIEQLDGVDPQLKSGESYFINVNADARLNYDGQSITITSSEPVIPQAQAVTPTFDPAAGTYASTQSVTIKSATSDVIIKYTTDGSMPSATNGTVYSGTISVSLTTTIKAIAIKTGMADSQVASAEIIIKIPKINLTYLPAYGSINEYLVGGVENVNYNDYSCVLLIRTNGKWWIKPGYASKLSVNPSDGTFSANFCNGGTDYLADKINIYLIPKNYTPPNVDNQSAPPASLVQNSITKLEVDRPVSPNWWFNVSPYSPFSDTLEIFYGSSGKYVSIVSKSNIIRPVFGPNSAWGGYFYFMPGVRSGNKYIPDSPISIDYFQTSNCKLCISISGNQGGLSVKGDLILTPPSNDQLVIEVKINEIKGNIVFDSTPENEIYKVLNLKSMFLNPDYCDSKTLYLDSKEYPFPAKDSGITIPDYYQSIVSSISPVTAQNILLQGVFSEWQKQHENKPAPSFNIMLETPMPISANNDFGTKTDVNSDTLNVWASGRTQNIGPYKYTVIVKQ